MKSVCWPKSSQGQTKRSSHSSSNTHCAEGLGVAPAPRTSGLRSLAFNASKRGHCVNYKGETPVGLSTYNTRCGYKQKGASWCHECRWFCGDTVPDDSTKRLLTSGPLMVWTQTSTRDKAPATLCRWGPRLVAVTGGGHWPICIVAVLLSQLSGNSNVR